MKKFPYVFLCAAGLIAAVLAPAQTYPDKNLTPGDFMHADRSLPTGPTSEIRNVPPELRKTVFDEYHIPAATRNGTDYEVDHFIPLCLGGSNDEKNLWPQTRDPKVEWNAEEKDKLENKLFQLVKAGVIPATKAQDAIRSDWVAAYDEYLPMTIHGENDFAPMIQPLSLEKVDAGKPRHVHYALKVPKTQTLDPDGPEKE